ncbi:hypothetical protein [Bacillus velezensis]|uniref:hypothetical protein n=1 Tax=Bacillus velezensis TaxID=492670 RepID=UPI001F5C1DCC|nr:hypothetical protein [Bacillus velezensis]
MKLHKCNDETHFKCENSALCHLCDGARLYRNSAEKRAKKIEQREKNKIAEKNALFRTHKKEKKEGMAFEKAVTDKWNAAFKKPSHDKNIFKQIDKKVKVTKPRIQVDEPVENESGEKAIYNSPRPSVSLSTLGTTSPKRSKPVIDAKRQVNSGALWYAKGDIKTQDYLMECKERGTINARGEKSISIPKDWLVKQEKEAFQENRPFWVLPFRYKNDDSIYLIKSFDQEIEMYQELRKLREEVAVLKGHRNANV